MVDERHDPREATLRHRLPWLELFRGFQVAIDFRKLLLAAAGILAMALGWWLLAAIFNYSEPDWGAGGYTKKNSDTNAAWNEYKEDRRKWEVMHTAAGDPDDPKRYDESDVVETYAQYEQVKKAAEADYENTATARREWALGIRRPQLAAALIALPGTSGATERYGQVKTAGELRTLPWYEDRGPNPYLVLTGENGVGVLKSLLRQVPVLLEPLVKFLRPLAFLLHPDAGPLARIYFLLVILWTLAVWALIGGAITRMAAVELARREKIGLVEAVRFSVQRFLSFFSAPLFPLIFVAIITVFVILFGFIHLLPWLGDLVDGLLWPLIILAGLIMAIVLIGLVGWPLMSATISAEGTDSWEAVSRSYSYVFQAPWHFLWYSLVALAYGAALVFFVNLMGSMTTYLGKWAISQTPGVTRFNREPHFLFVYAPTSYQWRTLLLDGGKVEENTSPSPTDLYLVKNGQLIDPAYQLYVNGTYTENRIEHTATERSKMTPMNKVAAFLVAMWLNLLFLLMIGFGYSYFWSSATIIYLLMRRKVDDADLDEVYLEEEDQDDFYKEAPKSTAAPAPSSPAPTSGMPSSGAPVTMVEPPTLRVSTPPPPPVSAPPPPPVSAPPPPASPPPSATPFVMPASTSTFSEPESPESGDSEEPPPV